MKRTILILVGTIIVSSVVAEAQNTIVDNRPGRRLRSLVLFKASVIAGASVPGSVSLEFVAPVGGTSVNLRSDPGLGPLGETPAVVPSSVKVPAGKGSANFQVGTNPVRFARKVKIIASAGGVTRTASFTVAPLLQTLMIFPSGRIGPFETQGTVRLNAPAPPNTEVLLTSSNPNVAGFPDGIVNVLPSTVLRFQTGEVSKTFPLRAAEVRRVTTVTISATFNRATVSGPVIVRPPF